MADSKKTTKKQQNYQVEQQQEHGTILISDSVIAAIAGIAATEVEGVARLNGNITNEIISKIGYNTLSKGVKVSIEDNSVKLQLNAEIYYGSSIPDVSKNVQEKVKTTVESMTGLTVEKVNVHIVSLAEKN